MRVLLQLCLYFHLSSSEHPLKSVQKRDPAIENANWSSGAKRPSLHTQRSTTAIPTDVRTRDKTSYVQHQCRTWNSIEHQHTATVAFWLVAALATPIQDTQALSKRKPFPCPPALSPAHRHHVRDWARRRTWAASSSLPPQWALVR